MLYIITFNQNLPYSAQLRVERDQHLKCMRLDCNLVKDLQVDLIRLQENVTKAQTQLKEVQIAQKKRMIEQTNKMASNVSVYKYYNM